MLSILGNASGARITVHYSLPIQHSSWLRFADKYKMNSPPSILDLAQQIELHHMKLKQGFRQVFGTKVFGYLHEYRMQMALQLLQDSKLSVTQVAETVGCFHLGYFSSRFKRKYGIMPSACRAGEKPTFL